MRLLPTAAAMAAFSIPGAAFAESQCSTRENVLNILARKYQEAPAAVGVTNKGGLVEVVTSKDGETWSIIVTTPKGMTCLVAAGENWRTRQQEITDPEA